MQDPSTLEFPARRRRRRGLPWRGVIALVTTAALAGALIACGGAADEAAGTSPPQSSGATDAPSSTSGADGSGKFTSLGGEGGSDLRAPNMAAPVAPSGESSSSMAESRDASTAPTGEPAPANFDFLGRSIIRSGTVELEVETVADSFERVTAVTTGAGGFVAQSRYFGRDQSQGASLTLRVPADRFDDVVSQLQGIAKEVRSTSTTSQDVTGEVTDLESTLRNLRAVEVRYQEMLGSARTIQEILQVQDRLNQTRSEIERAEGRRQQITRLADLSTLTVTLYPFVPAVEVKEPGTFNRVGTAWQESLQTLGDVGLGALVVLAYAWWVLPVIVLVVWVAWRISRGVRRDLAGSTSAMPVSIDTPQGTA